jgi:hypothetical protein
MIQPSDAEKGLTRRKQPGGARTRLVRRSEPALGIVSTEGELGVGAFFGGQLAAVAYPRPGVRPVGVAIPRAWAKFPAGTAVPEDTPLWPVTARRKRQAAPVLDLLTRASEGEFPENSLTTFHLLELTAEENARVLPAFIAVVGVIAVVDATTTAHVVHALGLG